MKNLILVSLLSLAPLAASAGEQIRCHELINGQAQGYVATVSGATAEVSEHTPAGPHHVATLSCQDTKQGPGHPDHDRLLTVCSQAEGPEQALVLSITAEGLSGRTVAELRLAGAMGPHVLAEMVCE